MSTALRRAGTALLALLLLHVVGPAVIAHAALESSDPADGAAISTPYVLVARYNEELDPTRSTIVVRDAAGTVVAEGTVANDDLFTMIAELPALEPGAYVAHWIAFTADDDGKTQGDISFTVVDATPPPSPTPTVPPTPSEGPTATTAPTASAPPVSTPTVSPAPTMSPGGNGQPTGAELIVPLILAGGVAAALGWFLLRRRPG